VSDFTSELLDIEDQSAAKMRADAAKAARDAQRKRRDVGAAVALALLTQARASRKEAAAAAVAAWRRTRIAIPIVPPPVRLTERHIKAAAKTFGRDVVEAVRAQRATLYADAIRQLAWRIDRIASYEAWAAGQAQRVALAKAASKAGGGDLWLVWDATLDRRTCARCAALDGKRVRASSGFANPPPLHGHCRCSIRIEDGGGDIISE